MWIVAEATLKGFLANILLFPAQNVMTALQLSIKEHKNLYGNYGDPSQKELMTNRKQMKSIDKKRIEILIKVRTMTIQDKFLLRPKSFFALRIFLSFFIYF